METIVCNKKEALKKIKEIVTQIPEELLEITFNKDVVQIKSVKMDTATKRFLRLRGKVKWEGNLELIRKTRHNDID